MPDLSLPAVLMTLVLLAWPLALLCAVWDGTRPGGGHVGAVLALVARRRQGRHIPGGPGGTAGWDAHLPAPDPEITGELYRQNGRLAPDGRMPADATREAMS